MQEPFGSYVKTVIAAALGAGAIVLIGWIAAPLLEGVQPVVATILVVLEGTVGVALLVVVFAGLVVMLRAARTGPGREDLFQALNRPTSDAELRRGRGPSAGKRALRRLLTSAPLVVGDRVRIRSSSEITATLDGNGCLAGLPFMAEMARFAGQSARVFRVVDKIYDCGGRKDFRRLRDTVLLAGLRCDGTAHDGCQAGCYLLWKTAWLERIADAPADASERSAVNPGDGAPRSLPALSNEGPSPSDPKLYTCQFTQLGAASIPLGRGDWRQDVRPLLAGNVTLSAFVLAMLTRLFNAVQRIRQGVDFPWMPTPVGKSALSPELAVQPGDEVRVRDVREIARTLNRSGRNLGLWFDRDMIKHTRRRYRVRGRIEKIIDGATRRMLVMKHSCIVLDDVYGSGEFLRFCAQHDYLFWRESWLERTGANPREHSNDHEGTHPGHAPKAE